MIITDIFIKRPVFAICINLLILLGGWLLARSALVAQSKLATRDGDPAFLEAKLITARFYAEVILPPALAQLGPLKAAGRTVFALKEDQF